MLINEQLNEHQMMGIKQQLMVLVVMEGMLGW
jgi:hypothetical protein